MARGRRNVRKIKGNKVRIEEANERESLLRFERRIRTKSHKLDRKEFINFVTWKTTLPTAYFLRHVPIYDRHRFFDFQEALQTSFSVKLE